MLRDPVDRAYSHYLHMVRLGFESLGFEDALRAEESRISGDMRKMASDPDYHAIESALRYSYVERGKYAMQLQHWFKYFDRSNVLLIQSEEFFREPGATFRRVVDWLGLPAWEPEVYDNFSYIGGTSPGPSAKMLPNTRRELELAFAPHNEALFELLGEDLDWGGF